MKTFTDLDVTPPCNLKQDEKNGDYVDLSHLEELRDQIPWGKLIPGKHAFKVDKRKNCTPNRQTLTDEERLKHPEEEQWDKLQQSSAEAKLSEDIEIAAPNVSIKNSSSTKEIILVILSSLM